MEVLQGLRDSSINIAGIDGDSVEDKETEAH
jgi:hypothetical protein